jgi:MoaA/NifB/PqqE/SkfB family radical SAM enzyme
MKLALLSLVKEKLFQIKEKISNNGNYDNFEGQKYIDIELTNRCNASCIFCPRDKTPEQGFMEFETFRKAIDRAIDDYYPPVVHLCGLGEPLLHPEVIKFVDYLTDKKIFSRITTNASLLSPELSKKLLKAGLNELRVSVSGINENYNNIHKLDFSTVSNNLKIFLKLSRNKCKVVLSMTKCDLITGDIESLKDYWREFGINELIVFDCINRAGSLPMDYYFLKNDKYVQEAKELLNKQDVFPYCVAPFVFYFIGWNGNYYLCCNDFTKKIPLGNVYTHSIEEIDQIKKNYLLNGAYLCKNCDLDPINIIREKLF